MGNPDTISGVEHGTEDRADVLARQLAAMGASVTVRSVDFAAGTSVEYTVGDQPSDVRIEESE